MAVFICEAPRPRCFRHQVARLPNFEHFFEDFQNTLHAIGLVPQEPAKGENLFKIDMDVKGFRPEELSVKVVKNQITIEAKHEEKEDETGTVSRHFIRKCTLPEDCRSEDVVSKLSTDGILTVSAPRIIQKAVEEDRRIPITVDHQPQNNTTEESDGEKK